jgi:predicted ATP-grasp superfamily ATP-dependent carboligase
MVSVPLPLYHDAFAFAAIRHLMSATAFRGIFSAEFKKDDRDYLYKLLEVNIRPWWYLEAPYRCGIDMATMAYHDALGHDLSWISEYDVGKRFYSPYYDYYACREARKAGQLSLKDWCRQWFAGNSIFFAWDDPMPTVHATSKLLGNKLRRMLGIG